MDDRISTNEQIKYIRIDLRGLTFKDNNPKIKLLTTEALALFNDGRVATDYCLVFAVDDLCLFGGADETKPEELTITNIQSIADISRSIFYEYYTVSDKEKTPFSEKSLDPVDNSWIKNRMSLEDVEEEIAKL